VVELLASLKSLGLLIPVPESARHAPPRVAPVEARLA
jgi:hypothetical protein